MKARNLLFILIFPFLVASCDNDGYSLDEFRISRATADSLGNNAFAFTLDNGAKLWVAAPNYITYRLSDKQRVWIDYTILSDKIDGYDHYIKLNSYLPILTKNIVELAGVNDSIYGDDPVKIHRIHAGGGFINIDFGFNYGGQKKHFINLIRNTAGVHPEDGKIYLEFRHNAYGDPSVYGNNSSVAFNPESLQIKQPATLAIRVKEFDTVKTYEITYDPKAEEVDKMDSLLDYSDKGVE